jgi:hypothetical protein
LTEKDLTFTAELTKWIKSKCIQLNIKFGAFSSESLSEELDKDSVYLKEQL